MRILVVGGISYNTMIYLDRFPGAESGTVYARGYHETVGSTGAGKALNLSRLGLQVTLHGFLGEDEYGDKVRAYFANERLRLVADLDPEGTPRHVNLMDPGGERISIFLQNGSFNPPLDLGKMETLIESSDRVVLNIVNYGRRLIPLIQRHEKEMWTDLHDYDGGDPYHQDFIAAADVLQFTSNNLPEYRAFMEEMAREGKKLTICTHGRQGATAFSRSGDWVEVPILPGYEVVDSNGAGDSFFAGVLYGDLMGCDFQTSLRLGAILSGLCVTSTELAFPELSPERVSAEYKAQFGESLGQWGLD